MAENDPIFETDEAEPTTTETVSPQAPKAEKPEPSRDEKGKFAPADKGEQAPAPSEPEPAGAPPAPKTDDKSGYVPLSVVLDEREKRQKLEAQVAEFRRQQEEARRRQEPPQIPDPIEDQAGFTQSLLSATQQAVLAERVNISTYFARDKFGDEVVDEAMEFFNHQPFDVSAQFLRHPMPTVEAVKWFQRQKGLQEIGDDPSAYRARVEAEIRAKLQAEMAQQQPAPAPVPSRQTPPRTLAAAPSAGTGPEPVSSGDPLFD